MAGNTTSAFSDAEDFEAALPLRNRYFDSLVLPRLHVSVQA